MRRLPFTSTVPLTLAAIILLGAASALSAHDFWLVPNAFQIATGESIEVLGQTSSRFPTSESAVATDRVADARVLAASGETRIADLAVAGKSLRLRARPAAAGQYVVTATLHWRSTRESAASFRRYLSLEGAPAALERIDREGLLTGRDSVTRRYAKYAKTLVQAGNGGSAAFGRIAGHPLEFVPERNPGAASIGDTLPVRLAFQGQPLAGARVHAGAVNWNAGALPEAPRETAKDAELVTDANGVVRIPIAAGGLWNVRAIHIAQAPAGAGADWDAHWATFVFHVTGPASTTAAPRDSLDVANVVHAYDRALQAGDSTAALDLLAADAVILESGGVETREEYRSHHLAGDIGYAQAVRTQNAGVRVKVRGDVAWAWSTSVTEGTVRGRQINSAGAELMVLTRSPGGWKIVAVHWSSRQRRP